MQTKANLKDQLHPEATLKAVPQQMYRPVHLSNFGFEGEKPEAVLLGLNNPPSDPSLTYFPSKASHVFDRKMVRELGSFLVRPMGMVFTIIGPHGSGKSSEVRQMAALLTWPIIETTASGSVEFREWVGGFQLSQLEGQLQPRMNWIDGPLLKAMRHGAIFVINEYDYARPAELAALNDVIETNCIYVQATNEVVVAHPTFRIIFTGNTNGYEDGTGIYVDTYKQNSSLLDRRSICYKDYMSAEQEIKVLMEEVPEMGEPILKKMIEVANEVRTSFKASKINVTISTRKLSHWAAKAITFKAAPNPLQYALKHVLLDGVPDIDAAVIDKAAQAKLGNDYCKPEVKAQ